MANKLPCFLFKQTRVSLDWTEKKPAVNLDITLPRHPGRSAKGPTPRLKNGNVSDLDSEENFKLAEHALAASVYYRHPDRFPRCILWRVLENWQVLALSFVDFTQSESSAVQDKVIRLIFPEQIQIGTVGFADGESRDELVIYALTLGGILYTISIPHDLLLRTKRSFKPEDICITYVPSAFTLNSAHLLLPISDQALVISLRDGSILKLDRNAVAHEGTSAHYFEKSFSDSSYLEYIKLKMPWVGAATVPYRGGTVYHTTVISAAVYRAPTMREHDCAVGPLLFTVSVDHSLKAWCLKRDLLLTSKDLLHEQNSSTTKITTWLDPNPSQLLVIINQSFHPDHLFYVISFSSTTNGRFRFWAAEHAGDGSFSDLVDMFPDSRFEATPPASSAPWIISEFRVTPASTSNPRLFDLWVLWKSDTNFRIQNIQFDIDQVPSSWDLWATATTDSLHDIPNRTVSTETSEDVTDHWMGWIFYPGRFPDTVLESALHIYENNFTVSSDGGPQNETTKARVARVVVASVTIDKSVTSLPDYEKYRGELDMQWERFARLCTELDKQRGEALSLVSDPVSGFVWTINVDGITALRACTESEAIRHNFTTGITNQKTLEILSRRTSEKLGASLQNSELRDAMLLVASAWEIVSSLPERQYDRCVVLLREEVTKDALFSVNDMMFNLYESCILEEVPEDVCNKVENAFEMMRDPDIAFQSLMSSLFHADKLTRAAKLTAFGARVLISGSQEVIHINHELLFNLMFLLVYITFVDEERPFHRLSRPEHIYRQLLDYFREYEVLHWLARNSVPLPQSSPDDDISQALTDLRVSAESPVPRTDHRGSVLQLVLPETFGPLSSGPAQGGSVALSMCIRQFLSQLELVDYGNGVTNVVSALLRADVVSTAADFMKFIPTTSWGTYMKARVQLKNGNYSSAATLFHRAAFGMSVANSAHFSALSLLASEIEVDYAVGGGLARYNIHIARLFEEAGASEYVVEFCNSALTAGAKDDTTSRSEMSLARFNAAVKVGLFDDAYIALTCFTDKALQRSSVRALVTAMVDQDESERLCSYPFAGLHDEVDDALEFRCHQLALDAAASEKLYKVLYAWRISHGDYRGAASILYKRLQRLQTINVGSADVNSTAVADGFLALINVLSCVAEDQAWILSDSRVDGTDGTASVSSKRAKLENYVRSSAQRRQVLTLADIRQNYRNEIDRLELLLTGGFFV